ncbi:MULTISPECIES: PAS domain-containing sensor histidine kinase [Sphingomonas]|uniref:histidine kinase n=1 Tax=Sphingomonas turrisvirgatae TaxID=1888892 RepID=A0A1E3M096_9SPHN|nr:PAS domain-containing sensor histidine kinase [Sphingomonas turrisvirgatae]ODP38775.1 PAS domain-containing sensor histidine kinase [Sphingomonas turrisvirgatae]
MSEAAPTEDLQDLYENAPCGYLSLSPAGRIVKLNTTLAVWLDTSAHALVGQSVHALLSFGGRIAFETHLAPTLRLQGTVNELALDLVGANGGKVPVIVNAAEKRGPDDAHLFTRMTIFKAVDRRAYERELVEARDRAQATANAEHDISMLREQFIAVLGHDLRNPLAALAAGLSMLRSKETFSDRGQIIAKEMGASISRATALIENVLDFARGRLGEGLTLVRDADEPLAPVLEQVVNEIRAVVPDRQIITRFALDRPVNCDRGRMAQLASNLISNAVTHGAAGMPIDVEAECCDGQLTLSVTNGGVAIPLDAQARLFQPFFRGAVRRSQQGLGLGLFIVNEIAKAHGGEMKVSSTDEATRFTFTMPLSGSAQRDPEASEPFAAG